MAIKRREIFRFRELEWELQNRTSEIASDIVFWEFSASLKQTQCHVFALNAETEKIIAHFEWEKHKFNDFTCFHAPFGGTLVLKKLDSLDT